MNTKRLLKAIGIFFLWWFALAIILDLLNFGTIAGAIGFGVGIWQGIKAYKKKLVEKEVEKQNETMEEKKQNSFLDTRITSKMILVSFVIIVIVAGILYWQNRKKQKEMIKLDACMESCFWDHSCRDKCREKYGVTREEYNEWKEKNK